MIFLFVLLNLVDLALTLVAIRHGAYEANPLPAWVYAQAGEFGLIVFKILGVGLFLWGLRFARPPVRRVLLVGATILTGLVCLANLMVLRPLFL